MVKMHWVNLMMCFVFFLLSLSTLYFNLFMENLKVGSLNINGGRDRGKLVVVSEFLNINRVNVVFLQETHSNDENEIEWNRWWEGNLVLSHGTNNSAGVAILFKKGLSVNILYTEEIVKGRVLLLKIEYGEHVFVLMNVYAPNNGLERIRVFDQLHKALQKFDDNIWLVLGGDWNCTINFLIDRNGEEPHSRSSESLLNIMGKYDLIDVWRRRNIGVRQYTWIKVAENMVSGARLDRFYLSKMAENRVMSASILPSGFSDHHLIMFDFNMKQTSRPKYYWHFNEKMLKDNVFCDSFKLFWEKWKERKSDFENLSQWWVVGKVQIKVFCQNVSAYNFMNVKRTIQSLQKEIAILEEDLINNKGVLSNGINLNEKRKELGTLLQERVKGALVRSRFCSIKDMDAPTAYFFNLEKKTVQYKHMDHLRCPNGNLTANPVEMRKLAVDFFSLLYSAEKCDPDSANDVLKDLPQLEQGKRKALDDIITYGDLTEAVQQLSMGRSPGIDGLTAEFYKHFWGIIGEDFYEVVLESLKNEVLPISCRRAVLSLLPKKGDLGFLKNWRPVSLLCLDYKILSKSIANRLKTCLNMLIHKDHTYCIPKRSIMDNLFFFKRCD